MKRRSLLGLCGLAALLLLPLAALAQDVDLGQKLPVDPSVRVGQLANGLTYYIRKNSRPVGRAELRLGVNAGSVLESDAQQGLAHLVEHMAFNGTQRFRKMEIVDYLESIGMRFGPEVNAYTSFDETVYMLEVPTDQPAILERAFDILYEWASRVAFEGVEIRKERGVVVEEWRQGRGASSRIRDKQIPVLLQGSRYAARLPIGKREVIEGAPDTQITDFYKDWYRPDLQAVVAVGDFDPAAMESLLTRTFSRIARVAPARPRVLYDVPDHTKTLFSVVSDPEATVSAVNVYVKREVRPFATVGDYRQRIVGSLATMIWNTRLEELARSSPAPFIQAWADVDRLVRTKEAFSLGAVVEPTGIERGLEVLLTEAERVRQHGFTATEVERAKTELGRGMERAWRERTTTTSRQFAEEYLRAYLTQEPIPGIDYEYDLHVRLLPGITPAEVNAAGVSLLDEANRVVLAQGQEKAGVSLPSESALAAIFERVRSSRVAAYVDTTADRPLVAAIPRPGSVARVETLEGVGAVRWTLPNGIRVILKPTDFRSDQVLFQAFSPGGTSLVSDKDYVAAITATAVVQEAGLGTFSAADLRKKLTGKTVEASPWIGEITEGLSGSASPRDLETLLQLVYLYFTEPRRDPVTYDSFKSRLQAYVANRRSSPEALLADTVATIMAQDHARARPLTPELLEAMNLDTSLRIYRERFRDPGDFTFIFVGNLDLDAVRPQVETWLGGLVPSSQRESWKDLGIDPPGRTVTADVTKGLEPKSRVALRFAGDFPWSRDEVVRLTAVADILEIRLREQLREELSGTYGASVSATAQKFPDAEYGIAIEFGCDPGRVEELTAAVFKEIAWIRDGTIDELYLTKERETLRRSREEALRENSFWVSSLQTSLLHGDDPAEVLRYYERVQALEAGVIRRTARAYLTPDRYVRVVLHPEAAPAEAAARPL